MKRFHWFFFLCGFLLFSTKISALELSKHVVEYHLPNGMTWLLVRRPQAPVFSAYLQAKVGGIDEEVGKTGLAHMFEHLMFKGTSRLGTYDFQKEKPLLKKIHALEREKTSLQRKSDAQQRLQAIQAELGKLYAEIKPLQNENEIWEIFSRNGAINLNASTSKDGTSYYVDLPINRLELWMKVYAEMLREPVLRNFYTERSVVLEERRLRTEDDPFGIVLEKLTNAAFISGPSHWSTIGAKEDIESLTDEDAIKFYRKNYGAKNLVGVLVGDIDISRTKQLLFKYFAQLPGGTKIPAPPKSKQRAGFVETITTPAEPLLLLAYHKPSSIAAEQVVFSLMEGILCDGPNSRLHKSLVLEKKLTTDVDCWDRFPSQRQENLLLFVAEPVKGVTLTHLREEIENILNDFAQNGPTQQEMQRVKNALQAGIVFKLSGNSQIASTLAAFESLYGDWRVFDKYVDDFVKVSEAEVQALAKKYLQTSQQITVYRVKD